VKHKGILKSVLAIALIIAIAYVIIFMTNIFLVEDCKITPNTVNIDQEILSKNILGKNIFTIDSNRVKILIEENPSVKKAIVKRHLPDSIEISMSLREKIIQVEYMNGIIEIASDGYVMDYRRLSDQVLSEGYLRVKGLEFDRFEKNSILVTDDYKLLENIIILAEFLKNHIEEEMDFVFIENNHLILQIQEEFIVDFGPINEPIENKLEKLKLILKDLKSKNINRGIINMRYEKNPVYYPNH